MFLHVGANNLLSEQNPERIVRSVIRSHQKYYQRGLYG